MIELIGLLVALAFGIIFGLCHGKPRWMMGEREKKLFDFQKIFGIRPECPNYYRDLDGWYVLVQNVVDRVLKNRAEILHKKFETETRLLKNRKVEGPNEKPEAKAELKKATKEAAEAESSFWEAHNTARFFVKVRKSYKDHLLTNEEWEAQKSGCHADGIE